MADEGIAKKQVSPIDAFKFQNLLFQQFGEDGVKVYAALEEHAHVGDLMTRTGISESRLIEVIEFMDRNGMISLEKKEEAPAVPSPALEAPAAPEEKPALPPAQPPEEEALSGEELEEKKRMDKAGKEKLLEVREEKPKGAQELSPFEKIVFDKFGDTGLRVYSLIDGEKTAEEILTETGISEIQLVEILEFMDRQGIIRLEKPEPEKEEEESALPELPELPKPLIEEEELAEVPEAQEAIQASGDIVPIDVPIRQRMGTVGRFALEAELMTRFGGKATRLYNLIDDRRDLVRLAIQTGLSFEDLDEILATLGQKGVLVFATLNPDDVRERYGREGEKIYIRYGREGVLFYELIGQVRSFKDMTNFSKIPAEKAVDIFIYINDVLQIGNKLDRDALLKELRS